MGLGYDEKSRNLSIGIIVTNISWLILFILGGRININQKIVLVVLIILIIINVVLHIVLGMYYKNIKNREIANKNAKNVEDINTLGNVHLPLAIVSILAMGVLTAKETL